MLCGCTNDSSKRIVSKESIQNSIALFQLEGNPKCSALEINISNPNTSLVQFYITPKAIDFGSYQTLIAGIIKPEMTEKEKALKLWNFTSKWSKMGIPPSRNREPCDPLKLFNSIEFALCGGINSALANLDSLAGLRSRVYHLSGHVVSEVFYNDEWHMFDADRSIYFLDDKGEVASVEYISNHPEIIYAQRNRIRNWAGMKLSYKMMQRVYSTKHNNTVNEWFKSIPYTCSNKLVLNKGDVINFKISKTSKWEQARKVVSNHGHIDYMREGILKRKIAPHNSSQFERELIFKEQSPYLVSSVAVNKEDMILPDKMYLSVYYSPDSVRWYFKGVVSNSTSQILFAATNADNEQGAFSYFLKFVTNTDTDIKDLSAISIANKFLFSDKIFVNDDNSFKLVFLNKKPGDVLNISISQTQNN